MRADEIAPYRTKGVRTQAGSRFVGGIVSPGKTLVTALFQVSALNSIRRPKSAC